MKFLRFGEIGDERPGVLDRQGKIRDLSAHVRDWDGESLVPAVLDSLATIDVAKLPAVGAGVRVGACVAHVGKLICIGLNYSDHATEAGMPLPTEPIIFLKATSSISGPNDAILIPPNAHKVDWEVELGVVIGKTARYLKAEQALEHVAGFCIVNDVTERSYQLERGGQWDKGKGCDSFAPLGPWLVTKDEITDAQDLDLWLEVEGMRYQHGNTRTMIFDVATIVAYVSQFMSLQPGDIIATGTPPGVGMGLKPRPVYLRAGQTVRAGITGLGEQLQRAVLVTSPG